jgi:DNA end-binding protein Ku
MAPRSNWKGYLKLSLVSASIAIYPATSSTEKYRGARHPRSNAQP